MLEPLGLVSHNSLINVQNIWPTSPNKQSVSVPVRLGENSTVITFDYKINRPSWPTSPYKLSSFVPVRLGNTDQLGHYVIDYLTIRLAARKGYGSIAHEAKPNGL